MSLWDDLGTILTGAGPRLLSTGIQYLANNQAAQTAQAGQRQRQQIEQQQIDANNAQMAQVQAATEPGVQALRNVLGTPAGQLTPGQQQGLDIAQKQEQTQLATSGLRGSGEAELEAMRGLQKDYIGNAVGQNIQRQDTAANALAQPGLQSYGKVAFPNVIGAGSAGSAAAEGAMFPAGAITQDASNIGNTLGAVSNTGAPGTSTAMDQLSSYIGATNKGQSRYQGQQTPLSNVNGGNNNGASDANQF